MNLLKIIKLAGVLVFIGFLLYVAHSFYKSKELINYTQLTLPMLIDVSEEWDITAVQKYINPTEFNRNITFYESMVSKSAYLGKFDSCINLQLLDTDAMMSSDKKIIQGNCKFTNGSAKLTVVISHENDVARLFHFVVTPK